MLCHLRFRALGDQRYKHAQRVDRLITLGGRDLLNNPSLITITSFHSCRRCRRKETVVKLGSSMRDAGMNRKGMVPLFERCQGNSWLLHSGGKASLSLPQTGAKSGDSQKTLLLNQLGQLGFRDESPEHILVHLLSMIVVLTKNSGRLKHRGYFETKFKMKPFQIHEKQ